MSAQHTAGPWRAKQLGGFDQPGWVLLWPDKGGTHMRRLDYQGGFTEHDARLIAAAPDLLDAAQAAWNCIAELPPTQARAEVVHLLQDAIVKAIGEQP